MEPDDTISIPDRAREILSRPRPLGFVATVRPDGRISAVPMAVLFDGETIRLTSPKNAQKVRNLAADPRITVSVMRTDDVRRYVEVRGVAEVEDDADRAVVNGMARDWMGMDEYPYDPPGTERVTITVRPQAVWCPTDVHGPPEDAA